VHENSALLQLAAGGAPFDALVLDMALLKGDLNTLNFVNG
jgi:hypothetical protein